ncbi:MAG TPA: hypothetical protein VE988_22460, partial [Gemmataceae bacterium]|nr:hypothetical protein [Gemmataceae bacterium]
MIWWIVDNITLVLLVLAVIALCCGAAWWSFRNNKLLIGVAAPVTLMLAAWVMSLFIVTDRKQLVRIIENMQDLINAGKIDEFAEYFDEDITVDTLNGKLPFKKAQLKSLAEGNKKHYMVKKIFVSQIDVEEISRPNADVAFIMGNEEGPERGRCRM